jgi:UDP-glucuronate decarboxylase
VSARHLVTGAAGLIGFDLARELLAAGDEVVAVDDGRKGGLEDLAQLAREHPGRLHLIRADLARDLPKALASGRFDTIAHLAAIVGVQIVTDEPYRTIETNLRSTLELVDLAIAHPPRVFLFASSSENYAFGVEHGWIPVPTPEDVPLGIDDPELPRWSYAASKIAGESALFSAARLAPFAPIVARFHNVYGPRMRPTHVIPEMLARCKARVDPFPVHGAEQTRSFLHVADAARALRILIEHGLRNPQDNRGIINVGAATETRIADVADLCLRVSGHRARIQPHPAPPGSVARRAPDVRKLSSLGFEPRIGLEEGVRACWEAISSARELPS